MLWIKAFHLIFVICWFAGLFYLPRLMVYHAEENSLNNQSPINSRFKIMERRLYYGIMWPAGILTTGFGVWLMSYSFQGYLMMSWIHTKLTLVLLLWVFHWYCGHCVREFKQDKNQHTTKFYRIINEIPTILLIGIVILAVVKP